MRQTTTRVTVPMPAEQVEELEAIAGRAGLSVAMLMRQGAIRIIDEFRRTGAVSLVALEVAEAPVAG